MSNFFVQYVDSVLETQGHSLSPMLGILFLKKHTHTHTSELLDVKAINSTAQSPEATNPTKHCPSGLPAKSRIFWFQRGLTGRIDRLLVQ